MGSFVDYLKCSQCNNKAMREFTIDNDGKRRLLNSNETIEGGYNRFVCMNCFHVDEYWLEAGALLEEEKYKKKEKIEEDNSTLDKRIANYIVNFRNGYINECYDIVLDEIRKLPKNVDNIKILKRILEIRNNDRFEVVIATRGGGNVANPDNFNNNPNVISLSKMSEDYIELERKAYVMQKFIRATTPNPDGVMYRYGGPTFTDEEMYPVFCEYNGIKEFLKTRNELLKQFDDAIKGFKSQYGIDLERMRELVYKVKYTPIPDFKNM